ncbi:MAG TPA: TRAP transporter substrate-binding protein [bacterium]|nr:TRAP transporter substrate-binding protein [bacterium]HPN43726.1 TRAP transporter substrate-binding protein [bacterium]
MRFTGIPAVVCFIFFSCSLVFTGCFGNKDTHVRLKLAHGLNEAHPVHKGLLFMAQRALEKSDSTLVITIYPNEQLGNEKECIEKLQFGSLDITKVSSSALESFIPELGVYALPFLFRDADHKWQVFQGPIGKKLLDAGTFARLKGLAYYDAGARSFYTTKRPILHPDSLKGLKIRTQQSIMAMKMIAALGGSATPISWGELYTALQQGVVDGAENNPPSVYTANHHEISKYYCLDEHSAVPDIIMISTLTWNKLSAEHKRILQEAADESVIVQRQVWEEFVGDCLEKMQEKGLQVLHPDKQPFLDKGKELWKEFDGTIIGDLAKQISEVQ